MKPWIAACLAMATGVTASLVVSHRSAEEPSAAANPAEARLVPVADPHAAMDQQRIARLERRVAGLAIERAGDGSAAPAPADDRGAAGPREEPLTEAEALARHRTGHDAMLTSVRAQAPDPSWSAAAGAKFTDDLGRLGAHVDSVDCRTTACVATLAWPSRAHAQQEYRKLIEAEYQLPCDRQIFLDAAAGDAAPYRATLVLDCEHVRAAR